MFAFVPFNKKITFPKVPIEFFPTETQNTLDTSPFLKVSVEGYIVAKLGV